MPALTQYKSEQLIKMLLIGDSGTGKTGALASLAKAGYNLRILDFDKGVDSIVEALKGDPEALARVIAEPCRDEMQAVAGKVLPKGMPKAFEKSLNLMTNWKTPTENLGPIGSWTSKDILVLDSLTFMGQAALRRVLAMNQRSGETPWQADWGVAMSSIEDVLALLYSDGVKCHVIITSHIVLLGGDEKTGAGAKGFPSALGSKLPPKVGRYFNVVLQTDKTGTGANTKRMIRTVPESQIDVKCPFKAVPKTLSIETGLAEFFKVALG